MVNEGTGSRPSPQMGRNGIHVPVAPAIAGKSGLFRLECPVGRSRHHDGEQRGARVNRVVFAIFCPARAEPAEPNRVCHVSSEQSQPDLK